MRILFTIFVCYICLGGHAQTKSRDTIDPTATEVWDPEPRKVVPGNPGIAPPSDAIVLFDGKDLSNWMSKAGEARWETGGGSMTVVKNSGSIKSKREFDDIQLHIEWRTPAEVRGEGQGRGNSGVYLQERYEVQVLDSFENRTYANGQAGSIYKQAIPQVNASRKPGEWQTFDIVYTAPRFGETGTLIVPAYMTVFHNGVLIHNHVALAGQTQNQGMPLYQAHGKASILLQDHGDAVSYRNIWVREL